VAAGGGQADRLALPRRGQGGRHHRAVLKRGDRLPLPARPPHGFHEHIYLGEIHYCRALHDPRGLLRELKSAVAIYPPKLKRAIIEKCLWEAGFSLEIARKPATRGETSYVSGCLFRGVACMVQALFALNERYFVNEKGSVLAADSFAVRPEGFGEAASELLGCPGRDAETLAHSLSRYEVLLVAAREACAGYRRGT
jgi:Domain of unknown function (DUF4037)